MSVRAAAVYSHHGIVWRSAKALCESGAIATPGGVRDLIEQVYIEGFDDMPEPLRKASQNAHGSESAARSFANANLLKLDQGYGDQQNLWTTDTMTPTRLGEPVTVFRLGKIEGGSIMPWCQAETATRAWALSEVSIAKRKADGIPSPAPAVRAQIEDAKQDWPKWERDLPLLVLEPDGEGWRGVVLKNGEGEKVVLYDNNVGLQFTPA